LAAFQALPLMWKVVEGGVLGVYSLAPLLQINIPLKVKKE